jgi:hypothetical protein
MTWTTWEKIGIDRQACAWFIKRHVDKEAVFSFASRETVIDDLEYSFDTPSSKWTHKQGHSTFYMFVKAYAANDNTMKKLAEIVDGADTANDVLPPPEAYGLEAICIGIRAKCGDDHKTLEQSAAVFDGLYEYLKGR